jgi:hypothetical protein
MGVSAADRAYAEARVQGLPELVDDPVALRKAAHLLSPTQAVVPAAGPRDERNPAA